MKGQAKKGGELGVNGEYYKGGQFMPRSASTVKGEHCSTSRKTGKKRRVLIEPGILVEVNHDENAIFARISAFVAVENGFMRQTASAHTVTYYGLETSLPDLIRRYNAGERYFVDCSILIKIRTGLY
ncbi:hypothetical protein QVM88_10985 [Providencia stuartii]|uniref:hypothetical protein n=1 Tax=Providencia stuartii TaxID=588 RepID=UPI0025AA872A|nr:hypothetical protein [Providencia stuartii]MDN0006875.1 hypothetical protein [Providencia stuartii]